ncbi:MAG: hypothetical protein F4205_05770 [Gemmatimonadetes bacterium]|nr:hypothetical protein [Gemmatimonadota bacterium]MYG34984.1 hypothetical protein [Gemmatimonadota bacterium]
MKPDQESLPLLQRLHERVFADPDVRAVLDAGFAQLAEELGTWAEPPHATCTVPIELFTGVAQDGITAAGEDPVAGGHDQIRLCRLFLLRRGARMAARERHLNSVQRLVSYRGSGSICQGVPGGDPEGLKARAIRSPGAKGPARNDVSSAGSSDLACHWDIVPAGVWHFPEADGAADWATVTFHSAAEGEIVDEYLGRATSLSSTGNPEEEEGSDEATN